MKAKHRRHHSHRGSDASKLEKSESAKFGTVLTDEPLSQSSSFTDSSSLKSLNSRTSINLEPQPSSSSTPSLTPTPSIQSTLSTSPSSSILNERGRQTTRGSAMADALHALNDSSASPSRFRNRSRSRSIRQREAESPDSEHTVKHGSFSRKAHKASEKVQKAPEKVHKAFETVACHNPLEGSGPYTLDTLYGTSKGLSRIVGTSLRSPMDFTLALSKVDRVTSFSSGLQTAGKELGLGFFDGVTGLVKLPIQGAKDDGAKGFIKGVGRGVAGIVVKPSAGIYALPGYTMMGVYKEFQKHLGEGVATYILSARIAQGFDEWMYSTEEEREEAVKTYDRIFNTIKKRRGLVAALPDDNSKDRDKHAYLKAVKSFVGKQKEKRKAKSHGAATATYVKDRPTSPSAPTHLSVPDSTDLARREDTSSAAAATSSRAATALQPQSPSLAPLPIRSSTEPTTPSAASDMGYESDVELEEVLRLSLRNDPTLISSSSNASSSTDLRRTITQSLEEMRAADEDHDEQLFLARQESKRAHDAPREAAVKKKHDAHDDKALRRGIEAGKLSALEGRDDDEDLKKAILESMRHHDEQQQQQQGGENSVLEDQELKRALEESLRLHRDSEAALANGDERHDADLLQAMEESKKIEEEKEPQRKEEEIVLEYVRRQSLAEDEWKKRAAEASSS